MFLIFFTIPFIVFFFVLVFLAPLPGRIARRRNHPQAKVIRMSGWTAILSRSPAAWMIALRWAYEDFQNTDGKMEISAFKNQMKKRK